MPTYTFSSTAFHWTLLLSTASSSRGEKLPIGREDQFLRLLIVINSKNFGFFKVPILHLLELTNTTNSGSMLATGFLGFGIIIDTVNNRQQP
jgi:hypothetical protein